MNQFLGPEKLDENLYLKEILKIFTEVFMEICHAG